MTDLRPIFVGGCSRSGTTLLAAMLGTGPEIVTVPEAEFKWDVLKDGTAFDGTIDVRHIHRRLRMDPKFALWRIDVAAEAATAATGRLAYGALLTDFARRYAHHVGKPQAQWWIDHTPGNIRYIQTLAALFPAAKFIHIIRDGRAVAASVQPLDFGPNNVAEAADYWSSEVAMGLAAESWLPAGQLLTVRFEDLVRNPLHTLQALCGGLGIAFRPEMISQRDYRVQPYTARQHQLVQASPDASRAQGWRKVLTPREIEIFEARTGELLGYLGYETDYGITARNLRKGEHLSQATVSAWRRWMTDRARRAVRRRRTKLPVASNDDRSAISEWSSA